MLTTPFNRCGPVRVSFLSLNADRHQSRLILARSQEFSPWRCCVLPGQCVMRPGGRRLRVVVNASENSDSRSIAAQHMTRTPLQPCGIVDAAVRLPWTIPVCWMRTEQLSSGFITTRASASASAVFAAAFINVYAKGAAPVERRGTRPGQSVASRLRNEAACSRSAARSPSANFSSWR